MDFAVHVTLLLATYGILFRCTDSWLEDIDVPDVDVPDVDVPDIDVPDVGGGCFYNTDCTYTYSGVDKCFMEATYQNYGEYTNEAFCYDSQGSVTGGECRKKRSIGEYCRNAGGNYDNNYCVTRLCSDTSGVCEMRESGCASFSDCANGYIGAVAQNLYDYTDKLGGDEIWLSQDCDDPEGSTKCSGSVKITPKSTEIHFWFWHENFDGILIVNGRSRVVFPNQIDIDMNLMGDFSIEATIPGMQFEVHLDINNSIGRHETTIEKEIELTDVKNIYNKSLKLGAAVVPVEIGVQAIGKLYGVIDTDSDFSIAYTVNRNITVEQFGVKLTSSGITLIGANDIAEQLLDVNNISINTTTITDDSVLISGDFQFSVGPQLIISINGIEFKGGVDLVFQTKTSLEMSRSGCTSGAAGMALGMVMGIYKPPTEIIEAMSATCKGFLDRLQFLGISSSGIQSSNSYGTHCQLGMSTNDPHFNLCDEAADFMGDVMTEVIGSKLEIDEMRSGVTLFKSDTVFYALINGKNCDNPEIIDINDINVAYGGGVLDVDDSDGVTKYCFTAFIILNVINIIYFV